MTEAKELWSLWVFVCKYLDALESEQEVQH